MTILSICLPDSLSTYLPNSLSIYLSVQHFGHFPFICAPSLPSFLCLSFLPSIAINSVIHSKNKYLLSTYSVFSSVLVWRY
jgi:hypothetical protein